ncbi:pentapeptide repeat-containing protein [Okeania sp. KiyG1]|uniref:pentapeptide repeat-containing protein n=1 Tax=Okeania sp. KiyG1 TaxID=2720165 RepID=UPI0019231DEE|nr:pentapeptide repeat-containing protein [Okeania sp. KiyG1]
MSTNKSKSEISDNTIDGALSHANVIKDNGKIESQQNNNTVSDKENNNQIIQGNSNNIYQINETPPQENISVEIKVSKIYQASNLLDSSVDKSEKIENLKEETDIEFIITGSIKNTRHKRKVKAIEKLLQELGCDPTLVIDDVDEGSLKFVLKGSPEGLERIERLFNSGELTEIFDVPIESVEFIGPEKEKLAFTIAGDISYTDVAKLKTAVTGVDEKELLIQKTRTYQGNEKLNLRGANLSEANLRRADFSGADVSRSNLNRANLMINDESKSEISGNTVRGLEEPVVNTNIIKDHGKVEVHQYNYSSEEKKFLAEAAAEIQELLDQLSITYSNPEEAKQKAAEEIATKAKQNPSFKESLKSLGKFLLTKADEAAVTESVKQLIFMALTLLV